MSLFMKPLQKYVVPVNIIVFGETEADALGYVEDAIDSTRFIEADGVIGVDICEDDIELHDSEDIDEFLMEEE
jgi:hypothetical protein